jgi:hypothetical protein
MNSFGAYVASAATVSVPLDLIAAGTLAATAGSAAADELEPAAEDVPALELEEPEPDDELLLLPHPATAATHNTGASAASQFLDKCI